MSALARVGRVAACMLMRRPRTVLPVRKSSYWVYRPMRGSVVNKNPNAKFDNRLADAVGTFLWFWILYHLYFEMDHLTGEFPYPDASEWTDEELGIPPDDEIDSV